MSRPPTIVRSGPAPRLIISGLLALSSFTDRPDQTRTLSASLPLAVAYQPRGFREVPSVVYPTEAEVKADLALLRATGFRGLVTYGAADVLANVPQLAREAGFDGMIVMGIWDPTSREELDAALAQAKFVDGFGIGNEGLSRRYTRGELSAAMALVRARSGRPVTTSERLDRYVAGSDAAWLIDHSDWIFPIAHPYWAGYRDPAGASRWIVTHYDYLTAAAGKRVILKEFGFPSAGDPCCGERDQAELFERASASGIEFFFFEAFDQPFKAGSAVEGHWGLFDAEGSPKRVIEWITKAGGSRAK
jgi:exo-beta-1,3-glucanase (GH17 family)